MEASLHPPRFVGRMWRCLESCLPQQRRGDDWATGSFTKFLFSFDLVRCIVVHEDGTLWHRFVSPSFATTLGHDPEALLGRVDERLSRLIPAKVLPKVQSLASAVKAGKLERGFTVLYPLLHADGHEVWFEHWCSLSSGQAGHCARSPVEVCAPLRRWHGSRFAVWAGGSEAALRSCCAVRGRGALPFRVCMITQSMA